MTDQIPFELPFESAYPVVLKVFLAVGFVSFISLFFVQAPYGRFSEGSSKIWGPKFSGKYGFLVQESPSVFAPPIYYYFSDRTITQLIFLIIWEIHYVNRVIIQPLLQPTNKKNTSAFIMLFAFSFQLTSTYLNFYGIYFREKEKFVFDLFKDPVAIIGLLIFSIGLIGNIISDTILRKLRKPGDANYYIPRGFLFEYTSASNYFCEMIEWFGFILFTKFFVGAVTLFTWTNFNLFPRSLAQHKWYKKKFGDEYPKQRKALIPFVL
ncbi:MAG: putative 3-oxo-5-alpha-steroid 4-dehydrogenase [Streblomastix strix]|uniref:Putative 3-oxo-5-alpha-steroid 4-dehydrogenase n=1 Tax=Streblomastix strix TaxID=222440 RepID=A0A5J4VVU3_9EUKA|nr:MAG: putative 3-oxo-5-alpha-steroid 4-dehydrogenase [Streblomastix strix]